MADLLAAFSGVKKSGAGWTAKCPAHEDRRASLSIGQGDDGRWLLHCHAGCELDAILVEAKLEARDLFPQKGNGTSNQRIAKIYDYRDVRRELQYQVVRYEPKNFRQRRPDGHGGWIWSTKGVQPLVYHRPDLKGREAVIVAEGEKDVDRLWVLGLPSTCNHGGAGKWNPSHTEQLVAAGVKRVVVTPDADTPGQTHGQAVAQSCVAAGLTVKIVTLPDGAKDVSAYLDAGGTKADLLALIKAAPLYEPPPARDTQPGAPGATPSSSDEAPTVGSNEGLQAGARPSLAEAVERSGLTQLTRDSSTDALRDALEQVAATGRDWSSSDRAALRLETERTIRAHGITGARQLVAAVFAEPTPRDRDTDESAITLTDDEPALEPVDGAALLNETAGLIRRHVVLTAAQADAIALWLASAYLIDVLAVMALLLITAPTMRAGKSTLLLLLSALAPRALVASNVTGAVLMRLIARYRPTMCLDEADAWLRSDDADMRGLINAGEYRRSAVVYRCAPDSHEPQAIPCFAARAIAMIGRPPITIVDRSLVIGLRRKRADESVARMRLDTLDETHRETRRRWRRWADDHAETIREAAAALADDVIPAAIVSDRARAHWRPLLAIADAIGGEWPVRAREAATALVGEVTDEEINIDLLHDIHMVFDDASATFMGSTEMVEKLAKLESRPWGDWRQGKPISTRAVADRLKTFDVFPGSNGTARGYHRDWFGDAWSRYPVSKPSNRQMGNETEGETANTNRQEQQATDGLKM